ncbi:hypothetical protein [Pararobbsia alpina]|nr:hypothetical protein [Pararobbsia alpina]
MWLVQNNVPFDVAFSVDNVKRTAWSIIFSEMATGKKYNFASRTFEAST